MGQDIEVWPDLIRSQLRVQQEHGRIDTGRRSSQLWDHPAHLHRGMVASSAFNTPSLWSNVCIPRAQLSELLWDRRMEYPGASPLEGKARGWRHCLAVLMELTSLRRKQQDREFHFFSTRLKSFPKESTLAKNKDWGCLVHWQISRHREQGLTYSRFSTYLIP